MNALTGERRRLIVGLLYDKRVFIVVEVKKHT